MLYKVVTELTIDKNRYGLCDKGQLVRQGEEGAAGGIMRLYM